MPAKVWAHHFGQVSPLGIFTIPQLQNKQRNQSFEKGHLNLNVWRGK